MVYDERYSRQVLFSPVGEEGQHKLVESTVLIVGAGATGSAVASQLARMGVGAIRIVDRDIIEMSNLHRQFLYTEKDVQQALPKAIAAMKRLKEMNSSINIEGKVLEVNEETVFPLLKDVDLVLDGTDNFTTRFLLNDACFKHGIPFLYGGAVASRGMSALFIPNKTPCMRCIFPEGVDKGETCDTVGVIPPVVSMVASYQVTEALKYLTGNENALHHSLKTFDIWKNEQYDIAFHEADPECLTCQKNHYPSLKGNEHNEYITMCGRNTVQVQTSREFDLTEWHEELKMKCTTQLTPFLLKARVKEDILLVMFPDGRVLIQGTDDIPTAKHIFHEYIEG